MKNTCKLFMLGLMLLGVAGVDCKDNPREVKAAEPGSYAILNSGALASDLIYHDEFWGDVYLSELVDKLTITNNVSELNAENGYITIYEDYCPDVEQPFLQLGTCSDGSSLNGDLFYNANADYKIEFVIYADVETIYANENSYGMFSGFENITEFDFGNLNTSKVTNMDDMFGNCKSLTELDLSKFDTSNVTNMSHMFQNCSSLTKLDLSNFDTSNVTDMSDMFMWCSSLTDLDLSSFNTSNVTNMSNMFCVCGSLHELDLSNFDTSNVTDMSCMFGGDYGLLELDVSNFDTSNVTDMSYMFNGCDTLTELDLSNFDTSNVTDMSSMFERCYSLTELDLSSFNTSNVTNMSYMFDTCYTMKALDLSSFDMSNVTNVDSMLGAMSGLQQINAPKELGNNTIELPYGLTLIDYTTGEKITSLDSSMSNKVLAPESDELKAIFDAIDALDTCKDYAQAPSIRAQYDELDDTNKNVFASLKNSDGVLLMDKLEYMEYMLSLPPKTVSGNSLIKALENNNYDIITIAVLTLTSFIGIAGYYFIQKRKSIKA